MNENENALTNINENNSESIRSNKVFDGNNNDDKNNNVETILPLPSKINTNSSKENATQIEDSIKSIEGKYHLKSKIQDNFIIDKIKNLNIKNKINKYDKGETKFVGLKLNKGHINENSHEAEKFLDRIFNKNDENTLFTDILLKRREFNRCSKSDKIEFLRKNIFHSSNKSPMMINDSNFKIINKKDKSPKKKISPNIEADSLEDLVINRRLKLPNSFKKRDVNLPTLPKLPIFNSKNSKLVKILKNDNKEEVSNHREKEKEQFSNSSSASNFMKIDDKNFVNKGIQAEDLFFSDSYLNHNNAFYNNVKEVNDLYFNELCNNNKIYCKVIRLNNRSKNEEISNGVMDLKDNNLLSNNIYDNIRKPIVSNNNKLGKAISNSRFLKLSKDIEFPDSNKVNNNENKNFKSNPKAIKLGFPPTKLNKMLNSLNEKTSYK